MCISVVITSTSRIVVRCIMMCASGESSGAGVTSDVVDPSDVDG